MTHQQAIEHLRNELSTNKASYTQEQLKTGYATLQTLIEEYLVLAGTKEC
jgi:hypothetical protein